MAETGLSSRRARNSPEPQISPGAAQMAETVASSEAAANTNESGALSVVLYVVGGTGADRHPAVRDFPLVRREPGQAEAAHVARVAQLVDDAIVAGSTHLLVPREHADWLGDHPLVAEYFAEHHEMVGANAETGIVFALYP